MLVRCVIGPLEGHDLCVFINIIDRLTTGLCELQITNAKRVIIVLTAVFVKRFVDPNLRV